MTNDLKLRILTIIHPLLHEHRQKSRLRPHLPPCVFSSLRPCKASQTRRGKLQITWRHTTLLYMCICRAHPTLLLLVVSSPLRRNATIPSKWMIFMHITRILHSGTGIFPDWKRGSGGEEFGINASQLSRRAVRSERQI
jgi:hypothetical protein